MTKTITSTFATFIDAEQGLTVPSGYFADTVLKRGDELELTEDFLELTKDRNGASIWPAIVDDEAAQTALWGRVRLVPGRITDPANEDLHRAILGERLAVEDAKRLDQIREARRFGKRTIVIVAGKVDSNSVSYEQ